VGLVELRDRSLTAATPPELEETGSRLIMTDALVKATAALAKTTQRDSLDDLIAARTRRSLLLVDCSASMGGLVDGSERKIDALRKVVATLTATHPVPVAAFGVPGGVRLVEVVPEPSGMTPLHRAIAYGREQGANHLVVVTDGQPDSEPAAFEEAALFGGPIDVFYIGRGADRGAEFCRELARRTGGSCGLTDLTAEGQKQLTGKIVGLLGDGGSM
jgi:hypothetical protein